MIRYPFHRDDLRIRIHSWEAANETGSQCGMKMTESVAMSADTPAQARSTLRELRLSSGSETT